MNAKVLVLLALAAAVAAESREGSYGRSSEGSYGRSSEGSYGHSDESSEPQYEFSYTVKDYYGNDYGHQEKRDGDYTQGYYYNHLPDGRLQKVTYYVDGYSGYVADVSYEGEAHYDSGSKESGEYYYGGQRSSGSRESYGSNESK